MANGDTKFRQNYTNPGAIKPKHRKLKLKKKKIKKHRKLGYPFTPAVTEE